MGVDDLFGQNGTVLDIGAGVGCLAAYLMAKYNITVVGYDIPFTGQ